MTELLRHDAVKVTVYFLTAVCLGAALTPPLYWLGQSVHQAGALENKSFLGLDLHDELARAKLSRYFNRALLIAALFCLWPLIHWLECRPRQFLQLRPNPKRFSHLGVGFGVAAGGLFLLGWILLSRGVFRPYPEHNPLAEILFGSMVAALCVALLEEFFFRGCILGLALRTMKQAPALLFCAVFFAALHFLKPPAEFRHPDEVTWSSGFWLVGRIFGQLGNPVFMVAEFSTLVLVGWILGYVRIKTSSLWLAIGLHAGWVFGIKVYGALTRRAIGLDETLPWIGKDLKSGLNPILVVGLTGIAMWYWLKKSWPPDEDDQHV